MTPRTRFDEIAVVVAKIRGEPVADTRAWLAERWDQNSQIVVLPSGGHIGNVDGQRLYLVTWGTQSAMVWSKTAWWAKERVRRQAFGRGLTKKAILGRPVRMHGPCRARLATPADKQRWADMGGPAVDWPPGWP